MNTALMQQFAADVRAGLTASPQKRLPCQYLYDGVGSKLFEAICMLPEYGLSRAGERLIKLHGGELAERLPGPLRVVELGSGSGNKTEALLAALLSIHRPSEMVYTPIDISATALDVCTRNLAGLSGVRVTPMVDSYENGLARAAAARQPQERMLVLFLGSSIGNFPRPDATVFLRKLREVMVPGDAMLLAADLVKDEEQMLAAYNDSVGATAAFNRNILAHINRELDATFPVKEFIHEVRYQPGEARVEMHLCAPRAMRVHIAASEMNVTFKEGETIWTESSHKYTVDRLGVMANQAGFHAATRWVDNTWAFSHELLTVEA